MSKQASLFDSFKRQREAYELQSRTLQDSKRLSVEGNKNPKGSVGVPSDQLISPSQAETWHRDLPLTPKTKSNSKKRSRQESIQDDPIPYSTSTGGRTAAAHHSPTTTANALPQQSSSFLNSLLPSSSQAPLISSSQRVEKNGKTVITASDGDTSDSESLPDPDELFVFGKERVPTPPTEPEAFVASSPKSVRRSARLYQFAAESPTKCVATRHTFTSRTVEAPTEDSNGRFVSSIKSKRPNLQPRARSARNMRSGSISPTLPRQQSYKFDLKSLVRHTEVETISKKHRSEVLEALKVYNEKNHPTTSDQRTQSDGREEALLTQAIQDQGDEGNIDRLLLALQRTESLQRDMKWSFFKPNPVPTPSRRNAPQLTDPIWGQLTKDPFSRDQTFLSGFAQDVASDYGIPGELIEWLIDALTFEAREDLRTAYVELLAKASPKVSQVLTTDRINELLRNLGAKDDALDPEVLIAPVTIIAQDEQQQPSSQLPSVLALLAYTAPHLNSGSLQICLHLACRLVIDDAISHNVAYQQAVDCLIAHLLEALSEDAFEQETSHLHTSLSTSILDTSLRAQLVSRFPALTNRTNRFRTRLATIFLLNNPMAPLPTLNHVSSILRSNSFAITRETDYAILASYITFLNVALSSISIPSPTATEKTRKAYDLRIDEVAAKVRSISSSIVDTGASHMKRTQVKQELESLHSRILYSMRTKRKRRALMLGDDGEEEIGGSIMRQGKLMFGGGQTGTGKDPGGGKDEVVTFGQMNFHDHEEPPASRLIL